MAGNSVRILLSTIFTACCLVLIFGWIRSYAHFDQLAGPATQSSYVGITSVEGQITAQLADAPLYFAQLGPHWKWKSFPLSNWDKALAADVAYFPAFRADGFFSLTFRRFAMTSNAITVPYWLLVATTALCGLAPWLQPHLSLRSLLLLITAAALFLGLCVDWSPTFPAA